MPDQSIICELSGWGALSVSGPDAIKFLQGQTTCDVQTISPMQGSLGGLCNYKGRLYAIFYLFSWQDRFYLLMPRDIVANTLAQLKKYAVFSKVTVQDSSNELSAIGVYGQSAVTHLASFLNLDPKLNEMLSITAANNIDYSSIQTDEHLLLKIPGNQARLIICGKREKTQKLLLELQQHIPLASENVWQLLDIQAGLPMISPATIGEFTPHQLNLPAINGVSFTKGCYTGQEIIARMHYLGKLKQHMYRASVTSANPPQAGEKVYIADNNADLSSEEKTVKEVGTVVAVTILSTTAQINPPIKNTAPPNTFEILVVLQDTALTQQAIFLRDSNNSILNMLTLPYTWSY